MRDAGTAVRQIGSSVLIAHEDDISWNVTSATGASTALIRVTGIAGTTINWNSSTLTLESD